MALSVIGFADSFAVSDSTLSFGLVRVPASATRTLEVNNALWEPVTFELRLDGDDAAAFSVSPQPFIVPPHASAELSVTFAPAEAMEATATLSLVRGGTTLSVALDGRAVTSALAVTPGSLDFGQVQATTTSDRLSVTLSNVLEEPVTVERVRVSDPAFAVDTQVPFTLEAGGHTTIEVSFTPDKVAAYDAHLRFVLEGQVEPDAVVAVTGQGVEEAPAPDAGDPVEEEEEERVEPGCGCGGGEASWLLLVPMLVAVVSRRRRV